MIYIINVYHLFIVLLGLRRWVNNGWVYVDLLEIAVFGKGIRFAIANDEMV